MSNETSPRPWRLEDGFECEIVDATGRHVLTATSKYAVPPLGDEREAANAALIVDAVNNIDRLRDELDVERSQHCTDIEQAEYHAEHHRKSLEAERDRLLDIVRRLARVAQDTLNFAEAMCGIIPDNPERAKARSEIEALLAEARSAIGAAKT